MFFETIKITNLRNIVQAIIYPHNGVNIIYGINGSGKTSILEAIYLLARNKTFRISIPTSLINKDNSYYQVSALFKDNNSPLQKVHLKRSRSKVVIQVNGSSPKKLSTLAKSIPVNVVTANFHSILDSEPKLRRKFIDWGLFHVEHDYSLLVRKYNRCLSQRNFLLRNNDSDFTVWDKSLANLGEQLNNCRSLYIKDLFTLVNKKLEHFNDLNGIDVVFKSGYPMGMKFREALEKSRGIDESRGYTTQGPHRSDFTIYRDKQDVAQLFSRGQLKVLSLIMKYSQIQLMMESKNVTCPVLLIDDLRAELDSENYRRVIQQLEDVRIQSFITTCDLTETLKNISGDKKVFHVELGRISELKEGIESII